MPEPTTDQTAALAAVAAQAKTARATLQPIAQRIQAKRELLALLKKQTG